MGLLDFFKKKAQPVKKKEKDFEGSWDPETLQHDQAQAKQVVKRRYHVVQKGESLSEIAQKYYEDAKQWKLIHQANQDKIKNPDIIHPGQELFIPPAEL